MDMRRHTSYTPRRSSLKILPSLWIRSQVVPHSKRAAPHCILSTFLQFKPTEEVTYPKRISCTPMTLHEIEKFPQRQSAVIVSVKLRKQVLKCLRDESAFWIVGAAVRAMLKTCKCLYRPRRIAIYLCFVNTQNIYPKPRIRKPAMCQSRRVGEVDTDDEHSQYREDNVEP